MRSAYSFHWPDAFGGFVAAIVVAAAVFGPPWAFRCGVDGTALWTAVGSITLVVTSYFGWIQFKIFNENDRFKNTLHFLDDFHKQLQPICATIQAPPNTDATAREANLHRYEELRDAARHGTAEARASLQAFEEPYLLLRTYLRHIEAMIKRGRLDRNLFFAEAGQAIVDTDWAGGLTIEAIARDSEENMASIANLAARAQAFDPAFRPRRTLTEPAGASA